MRYSITAAAFLLLSSTCHASWSEAVTDHMIVYSEQSPEAARDLAIEMERFDEAMRYMLTIKKDDAPLPRSAKLKIYQFGDTDDIGRLAGSYGVAGFFIPRAGDSVGFVPLKETRERGINGLARERNPLTAQIVRFHEYAHYFMFQHAAAAYPAWYVEGFAENYGTLKLTDNGFIFGAPASHRSDTLNYFGTFHVKRLLDPPEDVDDLTYEDVLQRYGMGWMLAHYLTFSKDRAGQLDHYFELINQGKSNLDAAEGAFGDLDKLNRDLDTYQRGKVYGITVTYKDYEPPVPKVRELTDAESAIMPIVIKTQRGVTEEDAPDVASEARSVAARYSNSVPVVLELAEAEFDAEHTDAAEAAAQHALELDPENAQAHIYLARIALRRAREDQAQYAVARKEYADAVRLDKLNPDALSGYYLTYRLAGETPPEDALIALEMAYDYAPFDEDIRKVLAYQLLLEKRRDDALTVLGPVANNPHGGKEGKKVAELYKKIRNGETAEAIAELAPKNEDKKEEEEDNARAA